MRLKGLLLVTALCATAMPAAAQGYRDPCRSGGGENQAAGLILGGILGGVLGSNVASSGHRHDGTAVGAVLGGIVGSEIGRNSGNCNAYRGPGYGSGAPYPATSNGRDNGYGGYPSYPPPYGTSPGYSPPPDYGYYPPPDDRYGDQDDDRRYRDMSSNKHRRLYGSDDDDYMRNDDYAGRDCSDATQITRLPDGTEIRRTVDACRDSYYGGWKVRD
jgi:hypothetical protein